ncbi:MAG: S-layer protein domain-containing protein [Candidatus Methanoperedens sp.]
MIGNTKKRLTIFLLLFMVGTLAGIFGYLNAKITTFEECEKAGLLVRSIRVYDGNSPIEAECVLWGGKSFVKEKSQPDNVSVLPAIFFPTQKEPARSYMQALLGADNPEELIIKDGCLRAGGFLLVWPYGFSLTADNGTFQVISTGQIVARVGDKIKVGGGADETPDGRIARGYSEQLLGERCSGPYFIVGEGITVETYTSPVATTPTLKSASSQYFPGQAFDEAAGILTKWDAENFKGFWRDSETGASTETLVINQSILNKSNRRIEKHNLIYTTKPVPLKYQVYAQANLTPEGTDGFYQATGWLGEKHAYLQGNRLEKIIFEQNATEEKELTIGGSWELGEGYRLIANSISAKDLAGRQSWLTLFKDSNTLIDIIMVQYGSGKIFTYQTNLSDSTPNFMIYCSRVDSLQYTDAAYFKYTWLRSQDIAKIREGDTFGVMEVISVKNGTIELRNKEPIDLSPGNAVHLMGDISIQVENSETGLVFYPIKWRR